MAFSANPLALSVPEAAFESWLRDTGYLELLDQRTSRPSSDSRSTTHKGGGFFSNIGTLISLVTLNPFSKLTAHDFSGETPSWTTSFIASFNSYTFPSSSHQARLRVHENVRRYARNYASLFVLFFACSLYPSLSVSSFLMILFFH